MYKRTNGVYNLFNSNSFHYQALRTLGHSAYQGSAPGEVLYVISQIKDQDEDAWYVEWNKMGEKCENWANETTDPKTKGNALLRASNYFRTSEFFLPIRDTKKLKVYDRHVTDFEMALVELGIKHTIFNIPYEKGKMKTYYFKGDTDKPLVLVCGGFDSTNTESYFWIGKALIDRGYSVAMFEGPGQSAMLRHFNIKFTPGWHKPVGIVIDYLIIKDPSVQAKKKVLFGISLGGLLMGRAAAFEKRIDGVALFGGPFDFFDSALYQIPSIARKLFYSGHKKTLNFLANIKMKISITARWGINNGIASMGGQSPYEFLSIGKNFTLKDVNDKVTCPVIVFYGTHDLFVADGIQDAMFKNAFKNAKSYTLKTFPFEDGSSEHCQAGSIEQSAMVFVQWMKDQKLVK
ncbi:alpha/beta hydrolase [Candidatus Peregrinibacteria bacterium]|nr:alpha/beta hydrolase [Candidatus Peregrinibacteria bacterium]